MCILCRVGYCFIGIEELCSVVEVAKAKGRFSAVFVYVPIVISSKIIYVLREL